MIWHSRDVNQYRLHTLEQKRLLSIGESEIKCEPRIRFWSEFWFKHHLFKGRTGLPMELKCVDWKPILANLTDLRQITCRDFFNPIATSLKGNRQFSAPLPNALNERLSMDDKDLLERRGSSPARLGKQVSTAVINGDFEVPVFKPMTFSDKTTGFKLSCSQPHHPDSLVHLTSQHYTGKSSSHFLKDNALSKGSIEDLGVLNANNSLMVPQQSRRYRFEKKG